MTDSPLLSANEIAAGVVYVEASPGVFEQRVLTGTKEGAAKAFLTNFNPSITYSGIVTVATDAEAIARGISAAVTASDLPNISGQQMPGGMRRIIFSSNAPKPVSTSTGSVLEWLAVLNAADSDAAKAELDKALDTDAGELMRYNATNQNAASGNLVVITIPASGEVSFEDENDISSVYMVPVKVGLLSAVDLGATLSVTLQPASGI